MSDPVKKEDQPPRGRLSSIRGTTRTFTPKIPSAATSNTPPPLVTPKNEPTRGNKRHSRGQRGNRKRDQRKRKAPKPKPIKKKVPADCAEPVPIKPVIPKENDRFDESGPSGTYPVSLPLLQPEEYEQNNDNLGSFLASADADTMMFMQLPSVLPISKDENTEPIPVRELPSGYLGKLVVYKSGKVQMKIGDILFDVAIGTASTSHQQVATISTEENKLIVLGSIKQRTVVTPNIEHLLANDFDDYEDMEDDN